MPELCLRDTVAWEQQGAGAHVWVAAAGPPGRQRECGGSVEEGLVADSGRPRSFLPPSVPPTTGRARQPGHQGWEAGHPAHGVAFGAPTECRVGGAAM